LNALAILWVTDSLDGLKPAVGIEIRRWQTRDGGKTKASGKVGRAIRFGPMYRVRFIARFVHIALRSSSGGPYPWAAEPPLSMLSLSISTPSWKLRTHRVLARRGEGHLAFSMGLMDGSFIFLDVWRLCFGSSTFYELVTSNWCSLVSGHIFFYGRIFFIFHSLPFF